MRYVCLSRWLAGLGSNEFSYLMSLHCGNISRMDLVYVMSTTGNNYCLVPHGDKTEKKL